LLGSFVACPAAWTSSRHHLYGEAMSENTRRAVVVTANGGPDVLEVQDVPLPDLGAGDVLVEVAASGVNFIDVYRRQGVYPVPIPFVLGLECAGRVVAMGPDVRDVSVGDVVASADAPRGTHATVAVVSADKAVPVPASVAPDIAAAAILQGITAHYLTNSTFAVDAGHEVLVHAAAGGVGQLLVQMVKAKGAHVVATVGTEAKTQLARAAGADAVIRYDQVDDLAAAVRAESDGGVHVAYDGVGKATFDASLASLRPRGMLALFGGASGQVPPFDPQRLNAGGSLFLTRPTIAHYMATREELLWRTGELFAAIADGSLRIAVGGRYPLERAGDAYRDLESRNSTGKLLIIP
jgi:NADPH2:quinone reductase